MLRSNHTVHKSNDIELFQVEARADVSSVGAGTTAVGESTTDSGIFKNLK